MKTINLDAARQLAAAISHLIECREDLALYPQVGDKMREQIQRRDRAEQRMREAFRDATGCVMVYRRCAYTARNA